MVPYSDMNSCCDFACLLEITVWNNYLACYIHLYKLCRDPNAFSSCSSCSGTLLQRNQQTSAHPEFRSLDSLTWGDLCERQNRGQLFDRYGPDWLSWLARCEHHNCLTLCSKKAWLHACVVTPPAPCAWADCNYHWKKLPSYASGCFKAKLIAKLLIWKRVF